MKSPHPVSECIVLHELERAIRVRCVCVCAYAGEDMMLVFETRAHQGRLCGSLGQRGAVPDKLHSDEKPAPWEGNVCNVLHESERSS